MTHAARTGTVFHLWWHPHNFGADLDANDRFLQRILAHYRDLNERYGMRSLTMGEIVETAAGGRKHGAHRPAGGLRPLNLDRSARAARAVRRHHGDRRRRRAPAPLPRAPAAAVGLAKVAGQLLFQVYGRLGERRAQPRRRAILARHHLDDTPLAESELRRVDSVNAAETIDLLRGRPSALWSHPGLFEYLRNGWTRGIW